MEKDVRKYRVFPLVRRFESKLKPLKGYSHGIHEATPEELEEIRSRFTSVEEQYQQYPGLLEKVNKIIQEVNTKFEERANMVKHKFHAKSCNIDGIKFASKKEGKRYVDLKLLQKSGDVVFFLRQTPIHLPGNIKYVCDYQVFWADGSVTFEDVKGFSTDMFVLKKKQVEALYPIEITLI